MEQIKKQKIKIIVVFGIVALLATVGFTALTAWSWNNLLSQTQYPDTTTFIGSSDVVQLGCYPENTVQSVTINKTHNTVVYSSDRSSNPTLVDIKLDKTEPRSFKQSPYKFQVYHHVDNGSLYTVQNGQITYNFTVEKFEITDNCTLEIFMFDSYFEFQKFLNTEKSFRSINRICVTTKKIKDEFVVNFTLPSLQYTYIAGIAIGVNEMSYSTVGGSVTTYNTSNYKQECTDIDDMYNTCSVKIGGSFRIFSHVELCLLVGEALKGNEDYIFVKTEITKARANIPTVSFTTCALVCCIIFIILVILLAIHCKHVCSKITNISTSTECDPSRPLLSNIGEANQSAEQDKVPGEAIND